MRSRFSFATACLVALTAVFVPPTSAAPGSTADGARPRGARPAGIRLDGRNGRALAMADGPAAVRFEPNLGQHLSDVRFGARLKGGSVFLTATDVVLAFDADPKSDSARTANPGVRLRLTGARTDCRPAGAGRLEGSSNYFLGSDPNSWRSGVPGYSSVRYQAIYPGIDLVFYGVEGRLEFDFAVAPGADLGSIRLDVSGGTSVAPGADGGLVLSTPDRELRLLAPKLYQCDGGDRRPVAGAFVVNGNTVGFRAAAYDASKPLVIDPQVVYSTYLGGSGTENSRSIAFDPDGNLFVIGHTSSANFPTSGPIQAAPRGQDLFVTKINAAGTAIVYSTYLGGDSFEVAAGIAVDSTGAATIAGYSDSSNFPTFSALQGAKQGGTDTVVARLGPDGSDLIYSTYLGGSADERCFDVDVDPANGAAYVVGQTSSTNFPTLSPAQAANAGSADVFASVISATGVLVASTYAGAEGLDTAFACEFDSGQLHIAGYSNSASLSGRANRLPDECDAFFFTVVWNPILVGLLFIVSPQVFAGLEYCFDYIDDIELILSLDIAGAILLAGDGSGLPFRPERTQRGGDNKDAFCAVINEDGTEGRIVSFGGSEFDGCKGVAADSAGNIYVAGITASTDFPVVEASQPDFGGGSVDSFLARINPATFEVEFATYIGGSGNDQVTDVATDEDGNVYVLGATTSTDLVTTAGALQPVSAGGADVFIIKFPSMAEPDFSIGLGEPNVIVARRGSGSIVVDVGRTLGFDGNVTVTAPNTKPIKVKLSPAQVSTTGGSVTFDYKVKKKGVVGTHDLVFTGRDGQGRERTATLRMSIE